jgi:ABC-type antimicrobial peptide transport system permease subunit
MHQSVSARTQEIGIRMALGADAGAVRKLVLTGGMAPAVAGLVLGLVGSFALRRTVASFLYETNAVEPSIYVGVTALLLAVTTAACLAPAIRASRADPVRALRQS